MRQLCKTWSSRSYPSVMHHELENSQGYGTTDEQACEAKCKYPILSKRLNCIFSWQSANSTGSVLHFSFILWGQPRGCFSDGLQSPRILSVTRLSGDLWWNSVYLNISVTADLMRRGKIWKRTKKNKNLKTKKRRRMAKRNELMGYQQTFQITWASLYDILLVTF